MIFHNLYWGIKSCYRKNNGVRRTFYGGDRMKRAILVLALFAMAYSCLGVNVRAIFKINSSFSVNTESSPS